MSMHRPSGCPSCAEPLEEGDRFCGVCGYAVTVPPPAVSADRPTIEFPPAPPAAPAAVAQAAPPAPAAAPAVPPAAPPTVPAPAGYAAAAPGWGTVASAAPTLVDAPAESPWAPVDPTEHAHGGGPEGPQARYDLPGGGTPPGGSTPPEGTAWAAPENPYAEAPRADVPYEARYEAQYEAQYEAPYEAPHEAPPQAPHEAPQQAPHDGSGAEREAPYAEAPQAAGKTCVACRAGHVDTDGYCEHCGHAQPRERDHLEEELGSVAAVSDRGLRHHRNEDSFAVAATALPDGSTATVAIVCDGVSSASRPDEASAAAAAAANEALLDALPRGAHPQEAMHSAILAAAAAVNALAPEVPGAQNAPACTLVGAVVGSGLLTIGWVGDSRAYWVPDDRAALPRRLTEDDSWAAQMVAAGLMGEAEAYADVRAHAITGWLGADAYELEPHTATFKPDHPGVVVVCTDGLWNYAESAREMAQVLPADAATRPLHSAQVLVGHALDGGGHDNVTVAVVPFTALAQAQERAQEQAHAEPESGTDTEAGARPQL
ncbi:protein phosphatase 2C domain-containing protein [Streptomyces sp. NPDC096339]|uniref:protein phosphatase 2C domain-containing protein n=1 Tax=Streptomyces sp. NPDC096339 TaxID=3366086 RepID=UPI0038210C59